jgi:Ferritin-like
MKHGMISQLRWTTPGSEPQRAGEAFARPPEPASNSSTGRCLELYGIPEVPVEKPTPANTAHFLLKVAAEIEHGLLVQYLYAMYSISPPPIVPPNWSTMIKGIALQEMDHLATVQNMLLALKISGFEPYFDRANFPIPKGHEAYYPYPFRLEPFTADSLSKYVSVESPLPMFIEDLALRTELETVIKRAEAVTGLKTFGHVGNLYAYLYWLFLPDDDYTGPWPNFPADWFRRHRPKFHVQATDFVDEVARLEQLQFYFREVSANDGNAANYPKNDTGSHRWVFAVKTADDALRAIAQIAIQGEGTETATDSHFLEFLAVYRQLKTITPAGGASIHRTAATDPHLRPDPDVPAGLIVNQVTRLWAELCNTRYLMLLQELPLAISVNRLNDGGMANPERSTLIGVAVQTEMKSAIAHFSAKLMTLPLDTDPTKFAGPPFELPLGPLPADAAGRWIELVRLIGVTNDLLAKLRALTGPDKPSNQDEGLFHSLELADQSLLQIVPPAYQPRPTAGQPIAGQQLNS